MVDIDFLPRDLVNRRLARRDQFILLGISGILLAVMIVSFSNQSEVISSLKSRYSEIQKEQREHQKLESEIAELGQRRNRLAQLARIDALLRLHPSFSHLLTKISESCPEKISFQSMSVSSSVAQDPEADIRIRAIADAPQTDEQSWLLLEEKLRTERRNLNLKVEITGLAKSDLTVFEFIDRLQRAGCFENVELTRTSVPNSNPISVRQFTIDCLVHKVL